MGAPSFLRVDRQRWGNVPASTILYWCQSFQQKGQYDPRITNKPQPSVCDAGKWTSPRESGQERGREGSVAGNIHHVYGTSFATPESGLSALPRESGRARVYR